MKLKVKMIKMASDIDENRNCRIWGIIPTIDNKYLFMEISRGYRPNIKHTNLSSKEYEIKYPNEEYIYIGLCFRVDIPEDYYKNSSKEFREYSHKSFLEFSYTNENIAKVLQEFNPNIESIELTNDYYIDQFCEEKGFFKLYDRRLEHIYEPLEIMWIGGRKDDVTVKFLYSCYAVDGTEFQKQVEETRTIQELITEYGKDKIQKLVEKDINKTCGIFQDTNKKEKYRTTKLELFNEIVEEINQTNNLQNATKTDELYDLDY